MPKIGVDKQPSNDVKDLVRPYIFHGVRVDNEYQGQAMATCPFCLKNKFYINTSNGLWDCKVCKAGNSNGGGNIYTFLRQLWNVSFEDTKNYEELRKDRKLLETQTLIQWGISKSITTDDWLIPAYGVDGKLNQLYRVIYDKESKKYRPIPTPQCNHHLHGVNLYDKNKPIVYICEGPWDGLALWEAMRATKEDDEGSYIFTASESSSLLADANVLATPGANVFPDSWLPLLAGKIVVVIFDSDHPKVVRGKKQESVGIAGVKRIVNIMQSAEDPPKEVHYVQWGVDGYDPDLPSGYDVRDILSSGNGLTAWPDRIVNLKTLLNKIQPIPTEWVKGRSPNSAKGGVQMDVLPCTEWKVLINSWRKAMKWTEGLDRALSVMLSCVTSTKSIGDQLWCKVIGPAACGKSTLCEAISVNTKYVAAKSTIRGFHSGYQTDRAGSEDNSLIATLYDKTLVTKDGDTLIQSPNLGQILAEARDIYDSTSRTHYRNKMGKDYQGVRMTWILCGTSSLRQLDSSELGERFLDCVLMDSIDDDLEDEILIRVANRVEQSMGVMAGKGATEQNDPSMTEAMQLTGGYITYLRENAQTLLGKVECSDKAKKKIIHYGKFVAYMRARPSTKQDESAEREFASRLVSQLMRLSMCIAVVLNKKEIDDEVLRRVKKTALDTARGTTLEIIQRLYETNNKGIEVSPLALVVNHPREKINLFLRFLRRIGVAENFSEANTGKGLSTRLKWRLNKKMINLYKEVVLEGIGTEPE